MSRARTRAASERDSKRKKRSRPIPKWLTGTPEIDDMAKRRCLMILSVLSGERPVTEVIEEHRISRGTYYNLETRALTAMLTALLPTASAETSPDEAAAVSPMQRIAQLERKIAKLEQDKRRGDRLLYLTRQILGPGTVKQARGRPSTKQAKKSRSTTRGRSASAGSAKKTKAAATRKSGASGSRTSSTPAGSTVTPSIPKTDGVDAR